MKEYDVAIIGTGPAGSAAAITLSRAGHSVLILERRIAAEIKTCETLPPVAIGIVEHFLGPVADSLSVCSVVAQGNISVWGGSTEEVQDFFFSPYGSGLCINRSGFDNALREATMASAGVTLVRGVVEVSDIRNYTRYSDASDRVIGITTNHGRQRVKCRFLIDAAGRLGGIGRKIGIKRQYFDDLFSYTLRFDSTASRREDAFTRIESCAFGWWYSNILPGSARQSGTAERIVILHTDKNLPEAKTACTIKGFLKLLAHSSLMRSHLLAHDYQPVGRIKGAPAGSERTSNQYINSYLAVGDAAQAFDPLSSQGLYQALQSGLLAGQMLSYALANDYMRDVSIVTPNKYLERYGHQQNQCWVQYRREYKNFYTLENRWLDQPFWARRHSGNIAHHNDATRIAL